MTRPRSTSSGMAAATRPPSSRSSKATPTTWSARPASGQARRGPWPGRRRTLVAWTSVRPAPEKVLGGRAATVGVAEGCVPPEPSAGSGSSAEVAGGSATALGGVDGGRAGCARLRGPGGRRPAAAGRAGAVGHPGGARQEAAQEGTAVRSPSTGSVSLAAGQSLVGYGEELARPSRSAPGSSQPAGRPGRTGKSARRQGCPGHCRLGFLARCLGSPRLLSRRLERV
jgi:hypothetical protein